MFQRPKPSFKPLEKLEAVDKRNPSLVRAARVAAVEEYRVKVHFDGWDDIYDDWFDADSFDLHPVGWCEKTGHALEPPLSKYEQRCTFYRFAALLKLYYTRLHSWRNCFMRITFLASEPQRFMAKLV